MSQTNWNPERSATQKAQVKAWLEDGKSITPIEALNRWGCFRLAAVINRLRNDGMDIVTEKYLTPSGKYVARYSLNNA